MEKQSENNQGEIAEFFQKSRVAAVCSPAQLCGRDIQNFLTLLTHTRRFYASVMLGSLCEDPVAAAANTGVWVANFIWCN
jgi:hypothetical protein